MKTSAAQRQQIVLTEEEQKIVAWNAAEIVSGTTFRRDHSGRYILWDEFGQHSLFGWQIETIEPAKAKASNPLALQAIHWLSNPELPAGGPAFIY